MSILTSIDKPYWETVKGLPRDTDWGALRQELEVRLLAGRAESPTLTDTENRLLCALRIREQYMQVPAYAQREKDNPLWWAFIADGAAARRAAYPNP